MVSSRVQTESYISTNMADDYSGFTPVQSGNDDYNGFTQVGHPSTPVPTVHPYASVVNHPTGTGTAPVGTFGTVPGGVPRQGNYGDLGKYLSDEVQTDLAPLTNAWQHGVQAVTHGPDLNPLDWAKTTIQSGQDMFNIALGVPSAIFNAALVHPASVAISHSGVPIYSPPTLGSVSMRGVTQAQPGHVLSQPEAQQQVADALGTAIMGLGGDSHAASGAARILDTATAARTATDVHASLSSTGAPVSDFVQGLFANRGVDTTPASDPRPSQITPMTTDHIALNAADHAQYQQLLQTGNVDDIKNFFKGRNGPQPSWSSVNRFVEQRDNPDFQDTPKPVVNPRSEGGQPFNYNDQYNQQAENDYNEQHRQAVEDHINNQMEGWKNAPSVEVVHSPENIADPEVRAGVQRDDPSGNALGVFGSDGQVHIFSGRITDPATASAVIFHEGLGHFGLSQLFGDRLNQTLISMADRNVSQFGSAVDARQASNPGESRALSAEEVLAQRSQKGVLPQSWRDGVTSAIRQFGRKMGLNLAYNDAEVNHILAMAHDAVVNSKPDVRANGFQGATQEPDNTVPGVHGETSITINGDTQTNKFITRSQLNQATSADYHSEDPERVFKALTENYHKESISVEDTRTAALAHGINLKDIRTLAETNPGELASRTYRLGVATNILDTRLEELESRIGTPEERATDKPRAIKAMADFIYTAQRFKGETSEAGRALNIAKAFPQYTNASLAEMAKMLHEEGEEGLAHLADDPEAYNKFMLTLKMIRGEAGSNPNGVTAAVAALTRPHPEQYINTLHMNAMLSAASTHFKAPTDMMTGIARNVIESVGAMPISKVRQMLVTMTGKTPKLGVELPEIANQVIGLLRSVSDMEVYKASWHALRTGESSFVTPTMDAETGQISRQRTATNFANQFGSLSNPRISGGPNNVLGLLNKPTDLISAQDTIFRSWEMNRQLDILGAREARVDLGPNASNLDVMARGHSIAMNPTPSMLKEAFKEANRTLLLGDNPLNTWVNKLRVSRPDQNIAQRAVSFVMNWLAPFIRVESNSLLERIIKRSPLGLYQLMDPRSDLMAGGAKSDIAISKMVYGTGLLALYWNAAGATKDYLTGNGPGNVDKYKEKIASGWRPNAVHENGGYNTGVELGMSVLPWDMHNKTAQLVASARQAWDSGDSQPGGPASNVARGVSLKLALGSVMSNITSLSWVNDLEPAMAAVTAHGQEAPSIASRFAQGATGSIVPSLSNQIGRLTDPVQRDTTSPNSISGSITNNLTSEIPGLREGLPIKYSVYGDPLANGASISGIHTWIPGLSGNGTTETTDPAERELDRLGSLVPSAIITPVLHVIPVDPDDSSKGKINLSPAQFEEYQRLAGKTIVYQTQQEMDSGAWSRMSDLKRIAEVRDIEKDAKKDAAAAIREAISHQ